ncbi:MAG TPA: DNA primase [Phycisphaerales bacterium]|nr:DNA primase [Phycisphaerales bacterium]
MPVKFDNNIISRIQQATDIVDVISEHLSLDKKGKEYVGVCPFHQDHRPSMYVSPVKQIFKCFACGAGGDAFKFIQLRENLSFPAAVERLADRAGIKLERMERRTPASADSQGQGYEVKYLAKVNDWAKKLWTKNLQDEQAGLAARNYISKRQISSESIAEWSLGFAVDGWSDLLDTGKNDKVPPKLMLEAGLIVAGENNRFYDKFRNRLMFPIVDVTGRVVAFGGRTLGDDPAKYMNSPATELFDKSNALYGIDKARHEIVSTGTAVVVEGYTDVMMCHQFGCRNVVATLGTSFTNGHARMLRRYAKRIVLIFDNDIAGTEAANRAIEVCLSQQIDIKIAFVAEGKDPCDFMLSAGADAFKGLVENATDVMEFKWQRLIDGLDGSDNQTDRRSATEDYLRTVATAMKGWRTDDISKRLIIRNISKIMGMEIKELNRELVRLAGRQNRGSSSYAVRNQRVVSIDLGKGYFARAQREILEVLLNEPKLFDKVAGRVVDDVFNVPILREIAGVLFTALAAGETLSVAQLLGRLESVECGPAVLELEEAGKAKGNFEHRLKDALGAIDENNEKIRTSQLKAALNDDETEALRSLSANLGKGNRRNPGMMAG